MGSESGADVVDAKRVQRRGPELFYRETRSLRDGPEVPGAEEMQMPGGIEVEPGAPEGAMSPPLRVWRQGDERPARLEGHSDCSERRDGIADVLDYMAHRDRVESGPP